MYEKHFGLERRIFRGNAAGPDVFVGPQVARIVSGVKQALAGMDAVVSVTGPVGSGKSTAVAHALSTVGGNNAVVRVGRFPLQRGEILDLLFDHMRIQQRPPRGNQKLALFRQLLFNLAANDSRMFVLVEDAPFLGPQLLAEIEVLTAADTGPSDGANIILMGDETQKDLLKEKSLARLQQRVRLRREILAFSTEELGGYLRHSFRRAGGDFDVAFSAGAAEFLHELSGGIPRVANNLVESSLEAAAEQQAKTVELSLVARIADEEFGLTGKFTTPPQIASNQPEPKHSDDATAELVALSLPEARPKAAPAAPVEPEPPAQEEDIPKLIEDTQPSLSVLPEPPAEEAVPELIQDTLPDLAVLSPELAEQAAALSELESAAEAPQPQSPIPTLTDTPARKEVVEEPPAPKLESPPEPEPPPTLEVEEPLAPEPPPKLEIEEPPAPEPPPKLEIEEPPAPVVKDPPVLTLEDENAPRVPQPTFAEEDKPDWDRDPTLAELRPDLEALERAMAVAHGADPDIDDPNEQVKAVDEPPPPTDDPKEATLAGVPEITLDDSISRKVDAAEIERKQREEDETGVVEEEVDTETDAAAAAAKQEKAAAELEKIAAGLAQAKTIEDVDDKMAETLFGEELSIAAAAVAQMVENDEQVAAGTPVAKGTPAGEAAAEPAAPNGADAGQSEMEKEFENVWGEKPSADVSIESQFDCQQGGLDMSASQRLATVRALNTENQAPGGAAKPAAPVAKPDSIEEQITTSMTQTLKTLNVTPPPEAMNDDDDDDDDDERKGGFFSRFRR